MDIDNAVEALLEEPIELMADDVIAVIGLVEDDPSSITTTVDIYKQVIVDFLERIADLNSDEEDEEEDE